MVAVLLMGGSEQADGAAPIPDVVGLATIFAVVIGGAVGCCAGLVAARVARTAARLRWPPVHLGAVAAGIVVGVSLLPLAEMWDLHPVTAAIPALFAVALAAWRLRTHSISPDVSPQLL